jgi:hypothetical protein
MLRMTKQTPEHIKAATLPEFAGMKAPNGVRPSLADAHWERDNRRPQRSQRKITFDPLLAYSEASCQILLLLDSAEVSPLLSAAPVGHGRHDDTYASRSIKDSRPLCFPHPAGISDDLLSGG